MSKDVKGINAENFVINLFDVIKCAYTNNIDLELRLSREEVQELGPHIEYVNWIEINES